MTFADHLIFTTRTFYQIKLNIIAGIKLCVLCELNIYLIYIYLIYMFHEYTNEHIPMLICALQQQQKFKPINLSNDYENS